MTKCSFTLPILFLTVSFILSTAPADICAQQYSNPYGQQGGYQNPYGHQEMYQNPYSQQSGYQNPYGPQGGYTQGAPYYDSPYGQQPPADYQGNYGSAPQGTYPSQQGTPGPGQWPASSAPEGAVNDALGRFIFTPPQDMQAFSAMYSFVAPSSNAQVTIMSVAQDQMIQINMQSFPNMVQSMGGMIQSQRDQNFGGRQARVITATIPDQQSGTQATSINAFIQGSGIWVQVTAPAQGQAQMTFQQVMQSIN